MNGSFLLDTNVVVALFNGDADIKARLEAVPEIYLPSVALGELHYGAACSGRPESNARRVDDFATTCTVIGVDAGTARQYGRVKGELRRKGRPIPENDLWIAAMALQHGLQLASRDGHFDYVEDLQIEAW